MDEQTPTIIPPPIPQEEPQKTKQPLWLAVSILAAVFVVVGSYFIYQKLTTKSQIQNVNFVNIATTTDQFANWKTYTDEQYKFEFKYPATLEVFKDNTAIIHIIHPEDKDVDLSKTGPVDGMWIHVVDNTDKLSVTDWWNKYGPYTPKRNGTGLKPDTFPIKNMSVGNLNGIYIGGSEGVLSNYLILPYMDKILEINVMTKDFKEILSTLKLPESLTKDWQTYRNDEFKIFEIKYPGGWVIQQEDPYQLILSSAPKEQYLKDVGVAPSGNMSITVSEGVNCSSDDFKSLLGFTKSNISVKRVCVDGFQISAVIWNDDTQIISHKELLNEIISTFKFIEKKRLSKEELANRILLTSENIPTYAKYNEPYKSGSLPSACTEKFNYDEPNSTTTYSNTKWGISFGVPYNVNWGNSKYRIDPYEEIEVNNKYNNDVLSAISWGYISGGEGCSWGRQYFVDIKSKKSAEDLMTSMKPDNLPYDIFHAKIETINNLQVVKYSTADMCAYYYIVVIGKKYNYEFTSSCNGSFDDVEPVVKTVKLLD